MAAPITDLLDTLNLSYKELGDMGFDASFIEDYLNAIRNTFILATEAQVDRDNIVSNTQRLDVVEPKVEQNGLDIALLKPVVASNTDRLDIAEPKIQDNTDRLNIAEPIITDNTDRLDIVEPKVTANAAAIALANGQLVGNNDFATDAVGGVVLLAALVADLTQIATVDISAAPATYDQAYTQSVTDLTNENKAKINNIVTKVNAIIAGQILAKQMSAT